MVVAGAVVVVVVGAGAVAGGGAAWWSIEQPGKTSAATVSIDSIRSRLTTEGLTKKDIIRCLKRFLAREVYQRVMADHRARQRPAPAP